AARQRRRGVQFATHPGSRTRLPMESDPGVEALRQRNVAKSRLDRQPVRAQAPGVPRRMFNLWSTYDFRIANIDGFRIGGGLRTRDRIFADAANTNAVPGWAVA